MTKIELKGNPELCKAFGTSTILPASSASGKEEGARPWCSVGALLELPYTVCQIALWISTAYLWDRLQPNTRQRTMGVIFACVP